MPVKVGSRWMSVIEEFVGEARISSKEVVSEDDRGSPLTLWESQKRYLREIADGLDLGIRTFYCLKGRQEGITTVSLLIDVIWLSMHKNLLGCLVTENEKNRDKNRVTIEQYIKNFPPGFFGDEFYVTKSNRSFMEFSNGSRLEFLVAGTKAKKSTSWAEGSGYTLGHMTEVAAYGDEEGLESLEEAFAQKNPNRLFLYESTAKGFTGPWRAKWYSGFDDPLTKKSFFLGWWTGDMNVIERSDPRFLLYNYAPTPEERELIVAVATQYGWAITKEQLAWIRWKEKNAGAGGGILAQNQPWIPAQAFIQSGYSFFQSRRVGQRIKQVTDEKLDRYLAYRYEIGSSFFNLKLEPIENEKEQGRIELKVFEEPVDGAKYAIGCDTAWGRNEHKDNQAIEVYRCYADRLVQVAEYATADVETKHCAWVLAHLAGVYKDCVVNIEINGPGGNIMGEWANIRGQLNSDAYQDQIRSYDWEDALGWARWYLYHRPDSIGAGYAYNSLTTQKLTEQNMHGLRSAFVTEEIEVKSIPMLNEMLRVVVDEKGHIGAPESKSEDCKDDRVYASAFAWRAWEDWVKRGMLANGQFYKVVHDAETGASSLQVQGLNRIVGSFFMRAEERARMMENWKSGPQGFLSDRGL
jgi:hypothetical protein